jgi:RNA polymerase sigma-70 factor (ECF subfamily)
MPPEPHEHQGKEAIGGFLGSRSLWRGGRRLRLVPTSANGQPAFGYYMEDPNAGVARAVGIPVLSLDADAIAEITRFGDTGVLPYFGLPRNLPVDRGGQASTLIYPVSRCLHPQETNTFEEHV